MVWTGCTSTCRPKTKMAAANCRSLKFSNPKHTKLVAGLSTKIWATREPFHTDTQRMKVLPEHQVSSSTSFFRQAGDSAFSAGLGLGGAYFTQGGVAGAVAGAPHVPGSDGAVGTPAFAESQEFFGFGLVLFAVGDGPAFLHAEVVDGENIGATEAEDQKHFHGPGADAADGGQAFDEFLVGEFLRVIECGDDAFNSLFGEVFHGHCLCAGEAGFAQSLFAELYHFLGCGGATGRAESFDTAENGCGGFAGDGLIGDSFEEGFIGTLEMIGVHLERLRFGDKEF